MLGVKGVDRLDYTIRSNPRSKKNSYTENMGLNFPSHFTDNKIAMRVLYENTLYPLAAAMGQTGARCQYTPHKNLKICLQCVVEDIDFSGTAFLHCSHQIDSLKLCGKHATSLYAECPACGVSITRHKIYTLAACSKAYYLELPRKGSEPHKYAKFVEGLLNFRGKPFTNHAMRYEIGTRIRSTLKIQSADQYDRIEKIIAEAAELEITLGLRWDLNLNKLCLFNFAVHETARQYLKVMSSAQRQKYH